MKIKTIFMGSPEFAIPSLQALAEISELVGIVTQPDRQAGRGRKITPPPVKSLAEKMGMEVYQPTTLRTDEAIAKLRSWSPDVIVVTAFGQILRQNVLDLPRFGCINVHASLLPRWRGAAPINAAILHGDPETGITIMKMDAGLDTGPILSSAAIPIAPDDNAGILSIKLAELGGELLTKTLPKYIAGEIEPRPQPVEGFTYAPLLTKNDGKLDFSQTAEYLARQVRAFDPWPGTFTFWKEQPLKILEAYAVPGSQGDTGKRLIVDSLPAISTASGLLVIQRMQPAGKKPMPGQVFLNGAKDWTTSQ